MIKNRFIIAVTFAIAFRGLDELKTSVPKKMFYRRFSDQSNLYVGMKLLCSARTIVCRNRFSSSEGESREQFLENVVNVHQSLP